MRALACLLVATALFCSPLQAQEQAAAAGGFASGGFGGVVTKLSEMVGEPAIFVGARGGWVLNHAFVLGGGAYALANTVDAPGLVEPISKFIYGGIEVEYIALASAPVHFSVMTLVGAGRRFRTDEPDPDHDEVFILEPAANVQVNVASFFRIDAGGGYRYVSRVTSGDIENDDLRAFFGALTLRFGTF